ncbi:Glycosyltransferase [human gut metagenome]|jgi:glycosyltransferase involved in cell wall biosynthesis|uniref:Glycosyltransferase n=1 Tax=human gut metagenome TaxID=408170 RepID=W1WU19_9ZZZZ
MNNEVSPLVSILLAVYKPNYDWFKQQLISLNDQTYNNLELVIYDDCPDEPVSEKFISKYITNFNYNIIRGKINRGSNKAFEELTKIGEGDYFAYCDQDDIWEIDKIRLLVDKIKKDKSFLVYSDMSVIDENGVCKYDTLIQAKPRLKYIYGKDLSAQLFFKNCVSGCCMLIKNETAKSAIPFSNYMIHDQWICLVASLDGNISFTDKPLVKYRIHGSNQTGSLRGVFTKRDYYNLRVNTLVNKVKDLDRVLDRKKQIQSCKYDVINEVIINQIREFCDARINRNLIGIFKYRYLCKNEAYFEMLIKYMPELLVKYLLRRFK